MMKRVAEVRERPRIVQYLAAFGASFSVVSSGINLGWTSPYLQYLIKLSEDSHTSKAVVSWCAVMPLVGAPFGAFLAALSSDKFGRKPTILAMAPPVLLSFLSMALFETIAVFCAARFVIGMIEGGLYTALPIYMAEIADPAIRGLLTSTIAVAGIIGTLFINLIGPHCTVYASSLICCAVPFTHFLLFLRMPESPYYHIKKLKFERAARSLRALRQNEDVEEELDSIRRAVIRQEQETQRKMTSLFTEKIYRKGVWIFVILNFTNKFSGKNPFLFYTSKIFEDIDGFLTPSTCVIIFCLVELFSTIFAMYLIDKFGRRKLMLTSSIGCTALLLIEGIYFTLKDILPVSTSWISITSMFLYNIAFSLGLAYGPVLLLGELFPTSIKTKALGLGDTFSVTMGTIASQTFYFTAENFGIQYPFFIFSFSCLIGTFLIHKFLIETKNKTLEEIQTELASN